MQLFLSSCYFDSDLNYLPLLENGNVIPGLVVSSPLTLTYNGDNYVEIGLADPFAVTNDIRLNATIMTNKTDETLLFQAT